MSFTWDVNEEAKVSHLAPRLDGSDVAQQIYSEYVLQCVFWFYRHPACINGHHGWWISRCSCLTQLKVKFSVWLHQHIYVLSQTLHSVVLPPLCVINEMLLRHRVECYDIWYVYFTRISLSLLLLNPPQEPCIAWCLGFTIPWCIFPSPVY